MSDFKIDIDFRQALEEIGRLKADMVALRSEMGRVQQAGREVFAPAKLDAQKISTEIDELQKSYNDIAQSAEVLKRALKGTFDPDAAKKYATAIGQAEAALSEMEATAKPLGVSLAGGFNGGKSEAQRYAAELDGIQAEYDDIAKAAKSLKAALKGTLDPDTAKRYAAALEGAEGRLRQLEAGPSGGALAKNFAESNKQLGLGREVADEFFGSFTKATLIVGAATALAQLGAQSIALAEDYKKTEIAFQAFLGTGANADEVIAQVNRVAQANGLVEKSAQDAAKVYLTYKFPLSELDEKLRQTADIAAGTGKDFNELALIFGKAKNQGTLFAEDINQLVEAGIPVYEEFAKILKADTSEVKKLASEGKISFDVLDQTFKNLTTGAGQFAGLAQKTAEVTGAANRASSEWAKTLRNLGDALLPIKNAALDLWTGLLKGVNGLINPTQSLNDEYQSQFDKVVQLDATVPKLVAKYKELSGNQNRGKTEQEELNKTMNALADIVPGAVEQVDGYGNALAISTDKIKEMGEAQKGLFAFTAEEKLAKSREELEKIRGSFERLQKIAEGKPVKVDVIGFGGAVTGQKEVVLGGQKEARKEILELRVKEENTVKSITETERVLELLRKGEQVTVKQTAKTEQELEQERQTAAAKQKQRHEAAVEAAKKRKQAEDEAFKAEQERAKLRASLLQEGVEKEKALEDIRFAEQNRTLKTSFSGRPELDALLEKSAIRHQANLTKIEIDALAARQEALDRDFAARLDRAGLEASVLEGIDRQKAELQIDFDKKNREVASKVDDPLEQLALQEALTKRYNAALAEIDKKAGEELNKKKIDIFREQQGAEAAEMDAAQQELLTVYLSGRKRTEEEIKKFEGEQAKLKELFQLQQHKKLLEAEIQFGSDLGAEQIKQREAQIREIDAKIKNIGLSEGGGDTKKRTLFDLLGIDTDLEKDILKDAASQMVDALKSITAAQVENARAAREAADLRVKSAEEALETELKLAELGFASKVSIRQKDLEESKAAQQIAIRQQQQAAKQQLAVDAALQVSSIVTATANILAQGAKFFPFGLIAAAAGIASVLATMAGIRARARAIGAGQFRHGGEGTVDENGVVRGPSHEGGGVRIAEVEGDEFFASDGKKFAVVNKKMTTKHFELLRAVNKDDRAGMRAALSRLVEAPRMRTDSFDGAVGPSATPPAHGRPTGSEGFSRSERQNIMDYLRAKRAEAKRTVVREGGTVTITEGNHTRIVRNG
jgi:tape measure domain-containing protein